jgi:hypothetical protein
MYPGSCRWYAKRNGWLTWWIPLGCVLRLLTLWFSRIWPGLRQVEYYPDEPSNVLTAEISSLLDVLLFIKSSQLGEHLILYESLSSIGALRSQKISARTLSIILECKEVLWRLRNLKSICCGCGSLLMSEYWEWDGQRYALRCNFYLQIISRLSSKWQGKWNQGEMSRYAFWIYPRVQPQPWFHGGPSNPIITVVSRLMSNIFFLYKRCL